jgi:AAA ATPase domain
LVAEEAGEGGPVRGRGGGIVGRERELAALRAWLDAARGGAGRLVLCAGEPGIGKTRLAQELAGVALAGDTAVAWGRCAPTEGAPAHWPWRQVLRSLGVDPDAVLAGQAESPEDRFRVFEDLTQAVLAVAARRGLVVVLDDIHWGDEPSLLVLRHLADSWPGRGCSSWPPSATSSRPASCPGCSPTCCGRRWPSASTCAASSSPRCASSWPG